MANAQYTLHQQLETSGNRVVSIEDDHGAVVMHGTVEMTNVFDGPTTIYTGGAAQRPLFTIIPRQNGMSYDFIRVEGAERIGTLTVTGVPMQRLFTFRDSDGEPIGRVHVNGAKPRGGSPMLSLALSGIIGVLTRGQTRTTFTVMLHNAPVLTIVPRSMRKVALTWLGEDDDAREFVLATMFIFAPFMLGA